MTRDALKHTFVYEIVKCVRQQRDRRALRARQEQELREWREQGRPVPPPHIVKQRTVKEYARKFSLETLIETGTYLGDMVEATKDTFARTISIELDNALYERAKERFRHERHIALVQGDSGTVLPHILAGIASPCLFWLDGHYSGGITARAAIDTPIVQELNHILQHSVTGHVILIDDARCFVGRAGYPTVDELRAIVLQRRPDWKCQVEHDIVRIHKPLG